MARLRNSNIFTWKFSINHPEYDARLRFSKQDRFDLRRMCRSFICVPLSFKMKFCHESRTVYIFTPIPSYRRVDRHRIFVRGFRLPFYAVTPFRTLHFLYCLVFLWPLLCSSNQNSVKRRPNSTNKNTMSINSTIRRDWCKNIHSPRSVAKFHFTA